MKCVRCARVGFQRRNHPASTAASASRYTAKAASPCRDRKWTRNFTAIAAVTAAIAVKFLVHFLSRHGLAAFAVYRLAVAAVLAAWFLG